MKYKIPDEKSELLNVAEVIVKLKLDTKDLNIVDDITEWIEGKTNIVVIDDLVSNVNEYVYKLNELCVNNIVRVIFPTVFDLESDEYYLVT
jgi:hypothetical protein